MKDFFSQTFKFGETEISELNIIFFFVALALTWVVAFIILRILSRFFTKKEIEIGKQYAIKKLVKYALYFVGFIVALQLLGLPLSGLVTISSALLIGVGIGLQQIFNDLFSGFIILFDRKVRVGDFVDIHGMIGRVDKIDLRTSLVTTLDNIAVVVPNSKLISDNVINWSTNRGVARFTIPLGVAYGSDVEKVRDLLIHCAVSHKDVLKKPDPTVFFDGFGDSSLDFKLLFWSRRFKTIENVKSDLRFAIDKAFRQNDITIPFPQMDVHMKKEETGNKLDDHIGS